MTTTLQILQRIRDHLNRLEVDLETPAARRRFREARSLECALGHLAVIDGYLDQIEERLE